MSVSPSVRLSDQTGLSFWLSVRSSALLGQTGPENIRPDYIVMSVSPSVRLSGWAVTNNSVRPETNKQTNKQYM